jgi:hypothetical protein
MRMINVRQNELMECFFEQSDATYSLPGKSSDCMTERRAGEARG